MTETAPPPELIELIVVSIASARVHRKYAFVDAIKDGDASDGRIQIVLAHDGQFDIAGTNICFKEACEYLQSGAVASFEGAWGKTRTGEHSLFAKRASLLRVAPEPARVLRLLLSVDRTLRTDDALDLGTSDGIGSSGDAQGAEKVSLDAAATLMALSANELRELLPVSIPDGDINPLHPLWSVAARICRHMTDTPLRQRQRKRTVTRRELEILESTENELRSLGHYRDTIPVDYPDLDLEVAESEDPSLLSPDVPLSDVDRRLAYERSKKAPQIAWFVRTIGDMLERRQDLAQRGLIVDVGGGRGGLACALLKGLGDRFPGISVLAVDINSTSLEQGRNLANKLPESQRSRIVFLEGDAAALPAETMADALLFVSLHACGGLSDLVLDLARQHGAGFLICQCCFPKHKSLRRWDENLEMIAPLAEADDHPELQNRAAACISAARLGGGAGDLLAFDRSWSPRNLVLKGEIPARS